MDRAVPGKNVGRAVPMGRAAPYLFESRAVSGDRAVPSLSVGRAVPAGRAVPITTSAVPCLWTAPCLARI